MKSTHVSTSGAGACALFVTRFVPALAEAGYAFALREIWVLEPLAQVIYVDTDTDTDRTTEPNGTRVDRADSNRTITRLGVRIFITVDLGNNRKVQPFATLS